MIAPVPPVLDTDRYVSYSPVSATTDFDIPFPLFGDGTDIEVYVDGVLKTISTDYTVLSVATGATLAPLPVEDGYIQFTSAQSGVTVEIVGAIHPRRTVQATSAFTTRDFNYAFSLLTVGAREAWSKIGRALRFPIGETGAELPSAATRASKYLAFDGSGNPIAAADPGTIVVSAFAETFLDDTSAAAVRTTIGAQASDATLTAIAGATTGADKLVYFSGTDVASTVDFTATGRAVAGAASATAARSAISSASTAQTDFITGIIKTGADHDFRIIERFPYAATITKLYAKTASGTITLTPKLNSTAITSGAIAVTSTQASSTPSAANVAAAGDALVFTLSANSSAVDISFIVEFTRTLA